MNEAKKTKKKTPPIDRPKKSHSKPASTSPSIAFGSACVEADAGQPLFVAFADGDYRLPRNSVCRDKGVDQAWMTGATDLAGSKRRVGTVDIGCYECGNFATLIMLQ